MPTIARGSVKRVTKGNSSNRWRRGSYGVFDLLGPRGRRSTVTRGTLQAKNKREPRPPS
jgi:hypothetical protein